MPICILLLLAIPLMHKVIAIVLLYTPFDMQIPYIVFRLLRMGLAVGKVW